MKSSLNIYLRRSDQIAKNPNSRKYPDPKTDPVFFLRIFEFSPYKMKIISQLSDYPESGYKFRVRRSFENYSQNFKNCSQKFTASNLENNSRDWVYGTFEYNKKTLLDSHIQPVLLSDQVSCLQKAHHGRK